MKISTTVGKAVLEFDSVAELEVFAAVAPNVFSKLNEVQQAAYAVGVTNAAQSKNVPDVPAASTQSPPPDASAPRCKHGVKKDLLGQTTKSGAAYKYRYYCPAERDDSTKCNRAGSND